RDFRSFLEPEVCLCFNSVCQGTHILFREFSFIQATPHNRASFLRAFWRCFRTVGKNGVSKYVLNTHYVEGWYI
ncbi:hypothetical protein FD754_011564, partial [Muntiacus muntjak]